ncbi:heparanase-like [Panulirus ornatus]|uniref:heparanase-like n=1 Tax=Panulirus ornatus TaxID=150431 RepID=UPI003A8C7288
MKFNVIIQILVLGVPCLQALNRDTNYVRPSPYQYTSTYHSHLRSCKAFTDLLQLVETGQKYLLSFQATSHDNNTSSNETKPYLTHRAELWINKFYKQLPRATKRCSLPKPLDSILEEQVNISYKGLTHPKGDSYVQVERAGLRKHFTGNVSDNCHSSTRNKKKCVTALAAELLEMASRKGEALSPEGEVHRIPEAEVLMLLLKILRLVRPGKSISQEPQWKMSSTDLGKPVGVREGVVKESIVEGGVVEVNTSSMVREVPATYLSLALGPLLIKHGWMTFNTSSPQLLILTRALAPAILRMGGSSANLITYDPTVLEPTLPKSDIDISSFNDAPESLEFPHGSQPMFELPKDVRGKSFFQTDGNLNQDYHGASVSDLNKGAVPHTSLPYTQKTRHNPFSGPVSGERAGPIFTDYFGELLSEDSYSRASKDNFTMTAGDWNRLLDFAEAVGMQLLFDVNQFYRDEDGWEPSNARLLMQDTAAREARLIWQLGNEPNSYKHNYNFTISGEQAALDFSRLQEELSHHFPQEQDRCIVGPDVTRPKKPPQEDASSNHGSLPPTSLADGLDYMQEFLENVKINLMAATWHQYYMDGHTAELEDFLSPDILNQLVWQTAEMVAVRDQLSPGTPLWLTETSSAWGGGAPGMSNAYVGGFLWMDKLGVAARGGVDLVARQTLYKGNYALIDADLLPYPDYWLSVLYKRLVGGRVLDLSLSHAPPTTRLYAHCQRNFTQDYTPGSVVVYGMNLANETTQVSLSDDLALSEILQYLLQAPDGDLRSGDVLLNGWQLQVTGEGSLPDLLPVDVPPGVIHFPPTSFGFWVLPHAHARACM